MVPEISLYLAHEAYPLWQKTEEELEQIGLPPPFWAFAWAGGQALARYILDNNHRVREKRVLDLASGSGLVAISAVRAGGSSVTANEIDEFALEAIRLNASLNQIELALFPGDLLNGAPPEVDVILAGDIFYEKGLAQQAVDWLYTAAEKGADVLIGDPGRSYLPTSNLLECATYHVPVTRELEDMELKRTSVWRLAN
jgi:predicted nicotinamide N-methyase